MQNILPAVTDELLASAPPDPTPDLDGMTSPRVKGLLNRCVAALPDNEAYLEIGCWQGASLISALMGNPKATAYACDAFCEFLNENPRVRFTENRQKYAGRIPDFTFFEMNCFELAKRERPFEKPIGAYFYDGHHSEESQMRAITEFGPFLAKSSIVIVDDWNMAEVRTGTWRGIDSLRPKNMWFRELPARHNGDVENFWHGIGAFYLELA